MARIPQIVSNNRASTEAPAVMQRAEKVIQPIDTDFGQSKIGEQSGQGLIDLSVAMKKVENANAKSKSKIETTQAMLAYEDRVKSDPSPDTSMKDYDEYMNKVRDTSAKNFQNPEARDQFVQDFELEKVIFKNQMDTVRMKKQVDIGRTNVLTNLDLESSNYINAQDDAGKLASRQKMDAIMADAVNIGLFDHEAGYKQVEKTIEEADQSVKDNRALAKRKEKELALAQKEVVNAREQEFIKMKVEGKDKLGTSISREELVKMTRKDLQKESVSPKFAELFINALKSPKAVKAKTIDKDFADILTSINEGKMKHQQIREAMLGLVDAGHLTEQDFATATSYLDMLDENNPEDLVNPKRNAFASIINFSKDNNSELNSLSVMSRNFKNKILAGVEANSAAVETMREEVLRLRPEARNYPEGMTFIDRHGRQKMIMPNGDLKSAEKIK